jgi:uncharacterized protein YceK
MHIKGTFYLERNKREMRKKMLVLSLILCFIITLSGCGRGITLPSSEGTYTTKAEDSRFMKVSSLDGWIYVDKNTNVQYLFIKRGNGAGLTVLLNSEGDPLLYNDGIK